MTVRLNNRAYEHAKRLINEGRFVFDQRDAWSEHQPSTRQENEFIERHGFTEYGKWHLAVNDEYGEDTKRRYEFPYGDFEDAHRCGILTAESRAGQYKHFDVENAAAHLHGMIDAMHEHRILLTREGEMTGAGTVHSSETPHLEPKAAG